MLDVLDVGCGAGFLTFELAARGHRVTGIDFAAAMLGEARRKATQRDVSVRFQQADAEKLPFMPRSFDLVISRHLRWTLANPEAAIEEWIRITRPGGRVVVVDGQFDPATARPPTENAVVAASTRRSATSSRTSAVIRSWTSLPRSSTG